MLRIKVRVKGDAEDKGCCGGYDYGDLAGFYGCSDGCGGDDRRLRLLLLVASYIPLSIFRL
jgi:hypothetical protein